MNPYYDRFVEAALAVIQAVFALGKRKGIRILVLGGPGHGDKARQLAFCSGVREKYPDACIFFLGMPFAAGSGMVDYDMAHHCRECGTIDGYYFISAVERELLIGDMQPHFDVVFDAIPYAVKAYWKRSMLGSTVIEDAAIHLSTQNRADQSLAPFRWLYDGYPEFDFRLRSRTFDIWEVMKRSSGIDFDPGALSLVTPVELAPWPEEAELTSVINGETAELDGAEGLRLLKNYAASSDEKLLDLGYVGDYVCVHNSAGSGGATKVAPPTVFKAIVGFLEAEGIRCVQIGRKGERKLADSVIDRTGLRLALTNRIMARPECLGLIGIDSLPMYMAKGLGKPAMILFGSTMRTAFGFGLPSNLDLVRLEQKGDRVLPPCPIGSCFRLANYGRRCLLPKEVNETPRICLNTLLPGDAGRSAASFATHQRALRDGTLEPEEAAV